MKRVAFLVVILAFVLTVPALAQDGGEFCAIPEGCDFDGDGVAETPAGAPAPAEDQYGPEEEFCAIPEGCEASASPDPADEGSASPNPPATSRPTPEEGASSAEASPPAGGDTNAGSVGATSTPGESAGGEASGGASASSAGGDGHPEAGLTVLPETGGAPAATLGLGVALVASGVLVRRVFR